MLGPVQDCQQRALFFQGGKAGIGGGGKRTLPDGSLEQAPRGLHCDGDMGVRLAGVGLEIFRMASLCAGDVGWYKFT